MDVFDGVGTFCVEMFIDKNEQIYVNEVAPRPHNSGHYTIEGCRVNQFENHIRAITGLPLGSTELLHNAVIMRNLLGQSDGRAKIEGVEEAYEHSGVNVHIYGKSESKTGRKMGHYTITADSLEKVLDIDAKIVEIVKITGDK
jgi:5-(carboxyamino)imidazole ribonucleotide synthase